MSEEISFYKFEKILNFNSPVYFVKIANGNVVAITKNIVLRINLKDLDNIQEIKIPLEGDLAHSLFIDPTGNHVIICMQSSQSYYLSKSSNKLRSIKEAKGYLINAVGWNVKQSSEQSTSNFLIGTTTGEIIEAKISNNTIDNYWNKIHILECEITGIIFDTYPDSNNSKYFLIITTPSSIYHYFFKDINSPKGTPIFQSEFHLINQNSIGPKCTTFPFDFGYSDIDQFYDHKQQFPKFISWMNGAGIYWTAINHKSIEAEGNIFLKPKLLNYSSKKQNSKPINVCNTEYHIILQYSDIINFFSIIHDEVVSTFKSNESINEQFRGLCKDHSNGFIYMFTNDNLIRINCEEETKNLWRIYAKLDNFEMADKLCNNPEEKMKIRLKHAEYLYDKQRYVEAGQLFASTSLTFEEATLKFIDLENKSGLKSYLLEYASVYKPITNIEKNSYDVIAMWLLELFFEEINLEQFKSGTDITSSSFRAIHEDYNRFLSLPGIVESLKKNKDLIYDKIKFYGDFYQSAIFAEIINDKVRIIQHQIEKCNIKEALNMLAFTKNEECHYMFGPKIISTHPDELVEIWIKLSEIFNSQKLLPILRTTKDEVAIKYVRHIIQKGNSVNSKSLNSQYNNEELHNFYILLCVRLPHKIIRSTSNDELMNYLKIQGLNSLQTIYDPHLALRICMEYKHIEGSVFLHCLLQKFNEAVDLALQEGKLDLAKEVALKFTGPEEVKKHLWLQIVKFIIDEKKSIEEVCRLVQTQVSLKLEDVLPYFPDSVKIEEFSEAICNSLTSYNKHIENLKKDMELANKYATKTKEEIKYLKQRPIAVPRESKCSFCHELLTLKPFCLFPCRHFFHMNCLDTIAYPMLLKIPDFDIAELKERFFFNPNEETNFKNEYYKLISNDCCFCGSISIDIIDKPLISSKEFETEMSKWD